MNDRAAFDAYFEDHPDDVAGLLAFADFLDEHGEAQEAEFTREMARRGVWPDALKCYGGLWQWYPSTGGRFRPADIGRGVYDRLGSDGRFAATGTYQTRRAGVADLYRVWLELGNAVWAFSAEVFDANV